MFILGRQKIGFVFHFSYLAYRISYFVGARNRRRTQRAPNIGGGCAFDAKNRVFFGWSKFVNAYVKRGKKNFKKMDFWLKPLAQMIDLPPPAAGPFVWRTVALLISRGVLETSMSVLARREVVSYSKRV